MTASKTDKCACVVWMKHGIEYCPLHKAAPELLEACLSCVKALETYSPNGPAITRLKAAIAKAEGRP